LVTAYFINTTEDAIYYLCNMELFLLAWEALSCILLLAAIIGMMLDKNLQGPARTFIEVTRAKMNVVHPERLVSESSPTKSDPSVDNGDIELVVSESTTPSKSEPSTTPTKSESSPIKPEPNVNVENVHLIELIPAVSAPSLIADDQSKDLHQQEVQIKDPNPDQVRKPQSILQKAINLFSVDYDQLSGQEARIKKLKRDLNWYAFMQGGLDSISNLFNNTLQIMMMVSTLNYSDTDIFWAGFLFFVPVAPAPLIVGFIVDKMKKWWGFSVWLVIVNAIATFLIIFTCNVNKGLFFFMVTLYSITSGLVVSAVLSYSNVLLEKVGA